MPKRQADLDRVVCFEAAGTSLAVDGQRSYVLEVDFRAINSSRVAAALDMSDSVKSLRLL